MKYSLYIGRWQPFHLGHAHIIQQELDKGSNVLIAVRDTPVSEADPYSLEDRIQMIQNTYLDCPVKVIGIPDIESVNIGREVGYDVNRYDAPQDIEGISATEIRAMIDTDNDTWKKFVPEEIAQYIGKEKKTYTIWFTGLPSSGKTTLCKALKQEMIQQGCKNIIHLDGDDVRKGLCRGLGFSNEDRMENLRRIAYVATLLNQSGNIVLASFVSPTRAMRRMVECIIPDMRMVHVSCPVKVCERRDVKGLYKKAWAGEIKEFTGISAPYEPPDTGLFLPTDRMNVDECVKEILDWIRKE